MKIRLHKIKQILLGGYKIANYYYLASAIAAVYFRLCISVDYTISFMESCQASLELDQQARIDNVAHGLLLPQSQRSDTPRPHLCRMARHHGWLYN